MTAVPPTPLLAGSPTPLTQRYDVALLDLDGVVYLGRHPVDGAPEALRAVRQVGMRLAFVTNNAARSPQEVAEHLTQLGIAADAPEVTTSAQAAAHYLAERLPQGAKVLVVGTTGVRVALTERGFVPVDRDEPDVPAVVQGFSRELSWGQLAQGCLAINRGALWIATNLDPTVPSTLGRLPGNGSLVAALRHATGRTPIATGKPDPTMHRESLERSGARRPIVVGDRLDTDIEGANAVGCASMLVFSGVTTAADLLAAPPQHRPTYLAPDVSGLLGTHRAIEASAAGFGCGGWLAAAGVLRRRAMRGPDSTDTDDGPQAAEPLGRWDALRAMCVAGWTDGRHGEPDRWRPGDQAAEGALAELGLG